MTGPANGRGPLWARAQSHYKGMKTLAFGSVLFTRISPGKKIRRGLLSCEARTSLELCQSSFG